MAISEVKTLWGSVNDLDVQVQLHIEDGWQPYGIPLSIGEKNIAQVVIKGAPDIADLNSVAGLSEELTALDGRITALEEAAQDGG